MPLMLSPVARETRLTSDSADWFLRPQPDAVHRHGCHREALAGSTRLVAGQGANAVLSRQRTMGQPGNSSAFDVARSDVVSSLVCDCLR